MNIFSYFLPKTALIFVYMLQQVEYDPKKFSDWAKSFPNLRTIQKRGKLVLTTKAKSLLVSAYATYLAVIVMGLILINQEIYVVGVLVILLANFVTFLALIGLTAVGKFLLLKKRAPLMKSAEQVFKNHQGIRIAVLGSYGKTTMKEILNTVLSSKFKVATTPGNKNVPISHARWASTALGGDEDILIIEYGEGEPGDIRRLASLSHPNIAIMTGVAPNHLDQYKTLEGLLTDFVQIQNFVSGEKLFVNCDATQFIKLLKDKPTLYSETDVDGWQVTDIKISLLGTSFLMKKGNNTLKIQSELLGMHNVGPLAMACALGFSLGMNKQEVEEAVARTKPFEHRMQVRKLNGAWLIDDTYNGNLMGFKAGLELLRTIEAKRKIYVTPGLVDQGEENERVHIEIGKAISNSGANRVILMQNSNTEFIRQGLEQSNFSGQLDIETNPLEFYTNIDHFVASGDVVLMQNDLPDAYK